LSENLKDFLGISFYYVEKNTIKKNSIPTQMNHIQRTVKKLLKKNRNIAKI